MKLQLDTDAKEVVVLQNVEFMELHKTLIKLVGKKDIVNWKVVTTKEVVNTWYPIWYNRIHYYPTVPTNPFYYTGGTHTTYDTNSISTGSSGNIDTLVYNDSNIPMVCSYNNDGTMNVDDHSTRMVIDN